MKNASFMCIFRRFRVPFIYTLSSLELAIFCIWISPRVRNIEFINFATCPTFGPHPVHHVYRHDLIHLPFYKIKIGEPPKDSESRTNRGNCRPATFLVKARVEPRQVQTAGHPSRACRDNAVCVIIYFMHNYIMFYVEWHNRCRSSRIFCQNFRLRVGKTRPVKRRKARADCDFSLCILFVEMNGIVSQLAFSLKYINLKLK